jgi:hypothetical protein
MLQLTPQEKEAVAKSGVTGELEVVYTAGRGSGSREVRVVIIQTGPLQSAARLLVPTSGSFVYVQESGSLKPLVTNSTPSSLVMEIKQQPRETVFFMDYPRDKTRYGGAIFWWDEKGRFREL